MSPNRGLTLRSPGYTAIRKLQCRGHHRHACAESTAPEAARGVLSRRAHHADAARAAAETAASHHRRDAGLQRRAHLASTLADMPAGCVDEVILVDDGSTDRTVEVARDMGLTVIVHPENRGYGGNQKTCYREALARGRHRGDDPPGLSVRQPGHSARGRLHRAGHLRRGAGQPHPFAPGGDGAAACRCTSISAIAS